MRGGALIMKQKLMVVLLSCVMLMAAGCGKKAAGTESAASSAASAAPAAASAAESAVSEAAVASSKASEIKNTEAGSGTVSQVQKPTQAPAQEEYYEEDAQQENAETETYDDNADVIDAYDSDDVDGTNYEVEEDAQGDTEDELTDEELDFEALEEGGKRAE